MTKDAFARLFAAFSADDEDAIRALIAPDAVWWFPGRTGRLAGAHRGTDAILAFLKQVRELTAGSFGLTVEGIIAEGEMVVVLFTGHAERLGRRLDNPTCLILRFEGGLLKSAREFVWDLCHVEDFWT